MGSLFLLCSFGWLPSSTWYKLHQRISDSPESGGNGAKTRIVQFGADEFGTNREALILKDHLALCPKSLADPSKLWSLLTMWAFFAKVRRPGQVPIFY